jgi:uncharacterized protein
MRACFAFTAILYHEGVEPAPGRARLRFHGELNDHSPATERAFFVPGSAKDLIESCGVPHTEVGRIEIGGAPAGFERIVRDGDTVDVYPAREPLDDARFVLDVHLGKLAAYLRMLGFDAFYRSCFDDAEIAAVSADEGRVLLTRDRGLLKRGNVARGYWLRETDSRRQAAEIVRRYQLVDAIRPFVRCMACNAELVDAAKSQVIDRLPPRTAQLYEEFRQCPRCRRIYWKGSHYRRMQQWIASLTQPR